MKKFFLCFLLFVLLLTACNKKVNNNIGEQTSNATSDEFVALVGANELCQGSKILGTTDNFAEGLDGTYCYDNTKSCIYYIQNGSNEKIPLCGKPECEHTAKFNVAIETCNAYFENGITGSLKYYNNKLYILSHDELTYEVTLYQIELDGSEKKEISVIDTCASANDFSDAYVYVMDEKYLYVISTNSTDFKSEMCRIDIKTGLKDTLFTGGFMQFGKLKLYNNNLFYQNWTKVDGKNQYLICRYDLEEQKEYILVKGENIISYNINGLKNELLYWTESEGLYSYSLEKGTTNLVKVCNSQYDKSCNIACTNKYIIVDNNFSRIGVNKKEFKRKIEILDFEYNVVSEIIINDEDIKLCSANYCSNKYIFIDGSGCWYAVDIENPQKNIEVTDEHFVKEPGLDEPPIVYN